MAGARGSLQGCEGQRARLEIFLMFGLDAFQP